MKKSILGLSAVLITMFVYACVGDAPGPVSSASDDDSGVGADTGGMSQGDGATGGDSASGDGGSCGDTTMSADNCGRCGHSCGGGACAASVCQPVLVASNVNAPVGVAVAGGGAFWIRNGAVERCPVTGCTGAPTVISNDVTLSASEPGGTILVTDGAKVAWIADGNNSGNGRDVLSCDVTGCNGFNPHPSMNLTDAPTQIGIEGSSIFVATGVSSIYFGPLATLVMAHPGIGGDIPTGVAADAANIYGVATVSSAASVVRCARTPGAGCSAPQSVLFTNAKYVAGSGGVAIATSTDGIKLCPATGCGGVGTVVMADDKAASDIAASGTHAAWTNPGTAQDGTVRVCTLPACTDIRTVAKAQDKTMAVTIADGFVYWVNAGTAPGSGAVWRAAL